MLKATSMPWLQRALAFLSIILVWQVVVWLRLIPVLYLPSVDTVAVALISLVRSGELLHAEILTLARALAGLGLTIAIAIPLAGLSSMYKPFRNAIRPIAELVRPLPPAALVPMTVFALGSNMKLYMFVVCMVAIWPTYLSALSALEGSEDVLRQTGRSFGCNRLELLRDVLLPQALPTIFIGIRLSASISLIGVVVAEMLAGHSGIGHLLFQKAFAVRVPDVFAITLICGLNGMLFNQGVNFLRNSICGWHVQFSVEAAA